MNPCYAANARQLLDARRKGMVPDGPVVVSLIGGSFNVAAVLYLHDDMPAERIDWRMLVNLEVWVWADRSVPLERLVAVVDGIARARPQRLCLRFNHPFTFEWNCRGESRSERIDVHDLDVGSGYHWNAMPPLEACHQFIWSPITHHPTPLERQLKAALLARHAEGTIL